MEIANGLLFWWGNKKIKTKEKTQLNIVGKEKE